jgi:hypothetical protein
MRRVGRSIATRGTFLGAHSKNEFRQVRPRYEKELTRTGKNAELVYTITRPNSRALVYQVYVLLPQGEDNGPQGS